MRSRIYIYMYMYAQMLSSQRAVSKIGAELFFLRKLHYLFSVGRRRRIQMVFGPPPLEEEEAFAVSILLSGGRRQSKQSDGGGGGKTLSFDVGGGRDSPAAFCWETSPPLPFRQDMQRGKRGKPSFLPSPPPPLHHSAN